MDYDTNMRYGCGAGTSDAIHSDFRKYAKVGAVCRNHAGHVICFSVRDYIKTKPFLLPNLPENE